MNVISSEEYLGTSVFIQRKRPYVIATHQDLGAHIKHADDLVQERRNSSALAMELHLYCTNPSMCSYLCGMQRFPTQMLISKY